MTHMIGLITYGYRTAGAAFTKGRSMPKRRTGLEKWGMALAAARLAAGKTSQQLADAVHLSIASISQYEHGKRMPGTSEIRCIEDVLGTQGRLQGAFDEWVADISPEWSAWRDIEEHADMLLEYQHSVVPGLLQTEDYARAVLSHDLDTPLELEQRVQYRMERQTILDREKPPTAVFVLRESAVGSKWQHIQSKGLTAEATLDLLKREAEKWQD